MRKKSKSNSVMWYFHCSNVVKGSNRVVKGVEKSRASTWSRVHSRGSLTGIFLNSLQFTEVLVWKRWLPFSSTSVSTDMECCEELTQNNVAKLHNYWLQILLEHTGLHIHLWRLSAILNETATSIRWGFGWKEVSDGQERSKRSVNVNLLNSKWIPNKAVLKMMLWNH